MQNNPAKPTDTTRVRYILYGNSIQKVHEHNVVIASIFLAPKLVMGNVERPIGVN